MDNISYNSEAMASAGLPYDNINWYNIAGQPFGTASKFNNPRARILPPLSCVKVVR